MSTSKREYWMTYDAEDLASKLMTYEDRYFGRQVNPVYQMWMRNSYAYYSTILDAQSWMSALNYEGDQGELIKMSIPQARSLIRQLLTLITKQKLAFNAIAQVQKSDVTEEVRIANALCEQAVQNQTLDIKTEMMVEEGLTLGTSFMKAIWRSDKGTARTTMQRPGSEKMDVIYDGDLEITTRSVRDLLYDYSIQDWDELDWVRDRVKRSRWSLIAQHPELEEEILKLPSADQSAGRRESISISDNDMVYVYELYHRPTPALPKGRMMMFSSPKAIYHDDENDYGTIPIERFMPEPITGIGFGYPMLSNLLASQEMYDVDLSAIATNHAGLGVQNVTHPKGSVDVNQIYGMNFIAYEPMNVPGGGRPETLNLLQSSPDLFKLPEVLLANMQQMSNINAAVRGELPGGTSGVAIATLTTNALEFLSSYSKCMTLTLEKVMLHSVNAYRKFANVERLVTMTGKNYQSFQRPFTGSMLEPIKAIKIQSTNPLLLTMAGRIEVADKSMANGLVKSMQDYAAILDGQPLSKLFETELSQSDLIQSENEMMTNGESVLCLSIDDHALHIFKHKVLLNDPRIRKDQARAKLVLDHILEHDALAKGTDPVLQAMANTGKIPEGGLLPPAGMGPSQAPAPPGSEEPQAIPGDVEGDQVSAAPELPDAQPAQPAEDLLQRRA